MNDILAIKNYVIYLKKECKLSVTLHSYSSNLLLKKELLVFNVHENPYCIYVKNCNEAQLHCIKKQEKVVEKCKDGSFCGTCWAGVKEFVYPVFYQKKVVGFISVSGYFDERMNDYISAVAQKYDLKYQNLKSTYNTLKKELPEKTRIDTLIHPLCSMIELAHVNSVEELQTEGTFIRIIVQYINKNYTRPITSDTLCNEFHCSRSHLSKIFNTEMKTTLREYINRVRIDSAKGLLTYSHLNISEIAFAVGFNNTYYFTMIFKEHTGVTPSRYRKNNSV